MSKKSKVIVGLAILLVAGVVVFSMRLNGIVRDAVNTYGPEVMGVSISLDDIDISLLSGEVALQGLRIGNPDGYSDNNAFALGDMTIKMDPMSITSDVIHIEHIAINAPEVLFEMKGTKSNLSAIQDGMASGSDGDATGDDQETGFIIDLIELNDGTIGFSGLVGNESLSLPMPNIQIRDLGKEEEGGADITVVMGTVMKRVTGVVVTAVKDQGIDDLLGDAVDKGKDIVKDVGSTIKGIFGGGKDDEEEEDSGDGN